MKLAVFLVFCIASALADPIPDPDVVGSVVSPISYGAIYTGIHNVDTTHTPGTISYGEPKLVYYGYYGRKKREAEPDPEVVGSVTHPISYVPLYTGIHSVAAKHIPGTVAYSAPSLFYYGRKKREAEPDPEVVGSVVSPFSLGAVYTGIHNVEATHIPGTVTYGQPMFFYYGRK